MNDSDHANPTHFQEGNVKNDSDSTARIAGILLIITALATVAAVVTRVSADADQPTLAESLVAIADSRVLYGAGGIARLTSAVALIAGSWYLSRTWVVREGWGNPLVPLLLAISGLFTAISGVAAFTLAATVPAGADQAVLVPGAAMETIDLSRWLAGKIGFAIAGFALLVAARQQWKAGGKLRRISPVSLIIGLAMQFIWIDSATFMHPINGTAFVLWLVLIGALLAGGFVERHFREMRAGRQDAGG